ncbi:MAG: hybrid sensor histidine kinase/response regulator [Planctomycetota bacterium]
MGSESQQPVQVFVIDDDDWQLRAVSAILRRPEIHTCWSPHRPEVQTFTDPVDAVASYPSQGRVVTLCDLKMPGASGVDWLPDLLRASQGPVIMLTGSGDEGMVVASFRNGAADYVRKTDLARDPEVLGRAISDALRRHRLAEKNRELAFQLKQSNCDLATRNRKLKELTDTAHRFVDNVAHEFRTPLTVIQEFASILNDGIGGEVNDKQREFLGHIESSVRDLSQMVDDFLDTSKLRANRLRVNRQPCRVEDVLERVRPKLQAGAASRKVELVERIGADLPELYCDVEKAGRALLNLVGNAIKFSPSGERVTIDAGLDATGSVAIRVADRGPGLSDEDIGLLSGRFQQFGDSRRSGKGFGLGLNIACDLAMLNLGRVHVESTLGEGSTFTLTLCPNDRNTIVRRYAEVFAKPDEPMAVSALRVTLPKLAPPSLEDARSLIAANGGGDGIVLSSMSSRTLVVVCPMSRVVEWRKAVATSWSELTDEPWQEGEGASRASVSQMGSWRLPECVDDLLAAITPGPLELRASA